MGNGRKVVVASDDRGPLVNIATWISIVSAAIVVLVKVFSKVLKARLVQSDDYCIMVAMVIAVAQSIVTTAQVGAGLGKHIRTWSDSQIITFEKTAYTSAILYVVALCFARLCVVAFFDSLLWLGSNKRRKIIIKCVIVLIILWSFISVVVLMFPCPGPDLWAILSDECIEQSHFWIADGVIGIVLDAFLASFPVHLVYNIQLPLRKKMLVIGTFAIRGIILPVFILRFTYISRYASSTNYAYDSYVPTLLTQVHMNGSIIASCIPFLKPFAENLQTGLLTSNLHTFTPRGSRNRYRLKPLSGDDDSGSDSTYSEEHKQGITSRIQGDAGMPSTNPKTGSPGSSQEALVIQQTTTLIIEVEDV